MLVVWCCVRGGLWRYLIFLAISLTNGILLNLVIYGRIELSLISLPLASTIPVLLTLSITKKFFGTFSVSASDNEVFEVGLQFKIPHLFIVTSALAIFIVIGKTIAPFAWAHLNIHDLSILGWISIVIASNTLLSVWALLGRRAIPRPIVAVVLGVALLFVSWKMTNGHTPETWCTINGIPFVAALGLTLLFRIHGWRFHKK